MLPPEDWTCSSSVQTSIDPLFYNTLTSVFIFLWTDSYFCTAAKSFRTAFQVPNYIEASTTESKSSFCTDCRHSSSSCENQQNKYYILEYPVSITMKKETQSKNGPCYRKRQGVPSAIKHERNWGHLKVLSSRYLLKNKSNKNSKISSNKFKFSNMEQ